MSGVSPGEFSGDRSGLDAYLRSIAGRYYVYVLCRPDGQPLYVGKGLHRRALEHEAEARRAHPIGESNPFKCNVIRKIIRGGGELLYKIDSSYAQDQQLACLEREAWLIGHHKRLHEGGCLTNLAGGLGNLAGAAPFSLDRHGATLSGEPVDNPERAILNRFLQAIGPVASVPVKPIRQIARILPTTPHPQPRQPTARCAYALVASASAMARPLLPGVMIPRSFVHQGVTAIIENGVARDMIKAGMANLIPAPDPEDEAFTLSATQIDMVAILVGRAPLIARGLL